jgi:hypothetical protein
LKTGLRFGGISGGFWIGDNFPISRHFSVTFLVDIGGLKWLIVGRCGLLDRFLIAGE